MDTCKSEHKPAENWTDKAIAQCRELLRNDEITKTVFDIKVRHGDCFFGDISTETSSKSAVNIADVLKHIDEAMDVDLESGSEKTAFQYKTYRKSTHFLYAFVYLYQN